MKLSREQQSAEQQPGMEEAQAPLLSSAEGYTNYGESQPSEENQLSIKKETHKFDPGQGGTIYAESKELGNGSFEELPDDYLQVLQEKQQQPPPSRACTRAVHKGKQLVIQKNDNHIREEQNNKQAKGWPHAAFYQNGKDARRGGTAPEGASRRTNNQVLNVNNPYNLLTTSGQPHGSNAGSNNSNKSLNQSQNNGSNANTSVNQQNQMIAKIYGKSNKFVHHGASLNDQYKKPKVHHMKEILRQKTNQQKQRSDGNQSMTQPGNVRKIKIDNSKLKSIQVAKPERIAETNTTGNSGTQSIRGSKTKTATTGIIEPSSPIQQNARSLQTSLPSNIKATAISENNINKPKKFVKVAASIEPAVKKNQSKTGVKISLAKPNSQKASTANGLTRGQFNLSINSKNRAQLLQAEDPEAQGSIVEPQSVQDLSVAEHDFDPSLQRHEMDQFGGQTQGQGFQKGDQSEKKQQFNQVKAFNYPSYKGNQPIRAIHDHPNQQRNNQSSLSYRLNSTANYNNIVDPNCSFEAVLQVASQDSNRAGADGSGGMGKGPADTEETPTHSKNKEFEFGQGQTLDMQNNRTFDDIAHQGHENQGPHGDPAAVQFDDGRHVLYAAKNNVQFSEQPSGSSGGSKPNRRGQKQSGGDEQQTDLETLGKLFNGNQDERDMENEQDNFSATQQQYCDMKRLQTSKGPRITKYKTQINQVDNKERQDPGQNTNSMLDNPENLYSNVGNPFNGQSCTHNPSRTGLLTGQNQSGRQQQQKQRSGTSHENNQYAQGNGTNGGNSSQVALVQTLATGTSNQIKEPEMKERPPQTAPSSEMQRIQRGQKNEIIQQNGKANVKYQIKGKLISNDESNILLNQTSKDMLFDDSNVIGGNQVQFSRTIDNINSSDLNMQGNNSQLQIMGFQAVGLPQPLPLQKANQSVQQPGHFTVDQMAGAPGDMAMNNNFTNGIEVPLHFRNDQLQRPPSRQKEPNQALGLDDDFPINNRPKTRGGNKSMNHVQFYGGAHVSGRDRKRNIQQYIPGQPGILSMQNMGQFAPPQEAAGGQSQGGRSGGNNNVGGTRPRMIDFFHQRNNNINGFNSTGDSAQQYFQMQYLQQQQSHHQQLSFDEKPEYQLIQSSNRAITQPSITTHSNILTQGAQTANQSIQNPRRGPEQGSPVHAMQQLQRPPSRHKDPPQNLGLDIYPSHLGGSRMGGGGLTPHHAMFGNSIGGGIVGLDVESDFDGDSEGQDFDIDVADNAGYFFGHGVRGGPVGVPQKHFKEDEEDFFDNQYREQRNDSDEKQKRNYHQRGNNQNYSHLQGPGPQLVPGTAPSPNQSQYHGNYQYHPALQQTQNFYIGMNQIIPQPGETTQVLQTTDFFNMDAKQMKRVNQTSAGFNSTGFNNTQHIISSDSAAGMQVQGLNHTQTDFIQRCFNQQRSPQNDRSEAIQQLVMQNPHLKQMNKPKSANGNTNNKNRFKSLNNSGRFVGQNSTIIHHSRHSGYNNQNIQHLKMYSNNPKAGGWIDPAPQANTTGQVSLNAGVGHKLQKSQLNKTMIKPSTSNGSATNCGARGQLFLGNNGESTDKQDQIQEHPDKIKEMIKTGQEINHNRPKESKGHRSSEKRHINNQSLGVTSSGGGAGGGLHVIPMHSGHVKRIYHPKNGNFVSSPLSGKGMHSSNLLGGPGGQSMKNTKQNGITEMFSQTSKFSRGARGTNPGLDGQQNSMGAADMLADLTDGGHNISSAFPFAINNQNSFKSQTLQFPNKLNSELTDDFINLFAS